MGFDAASRRRKKKEAQKEERRHRKSPEEKGGAKRRAAAQKEPAPSMPVKMMASEAVPLNALHTFLVFVWGAGFGILSLYESAAKTRIVLKVWNKKNMQKKAGCGTSVGNALQAATLARSAAAQEEVLAHAMPEQPTKEAWDTRQALRLGS